MNASSRQALWQRLREGGLVEADLPEEGGTESPWYVRVMLGAAGWVGSLFLLGFVGVGLSFVLQSAAASLLVGALACGGALMLFRADRDNDFITQAALAIALTGQMLLVYGLYELLGKNESLFYFLLFVVEALLTLAMPNFISRVMTTVAASLALSLALGSAGFYKVAPALTAAGFALVWLRDTRWAAFADVLRPVGYGLAFSLLLDRVGMLWGLGLGWPRPHGGPGRLAVHAPWLGTALMTAVLLAVVFVIIRRMHIAAASRSGMAALGAAALLASASFAAPGIAQALLILIVGFAVRNGVLIGVGLLAFCGFISRYYYLMEATLLVKSIWLTALGTALIGGRLAMERWLPSAVAGGQSDA